MRQMTLRAIVLIIITSAFLFGVALFLIFYVTEGEDWALFRSNSHIYLSGELSTAGEITDDSGIVLAKTVDGKREFSDDYKIRLATLHAIGDTGGKISTGMHTSYISQLSGFNLINGAYTADGRGNNMRLTINSNVCAAALDALGDYKGTVGVYNYKTGKIICMVSTPTYDVLNPLTKNQEHSSEYKGVYINRFLSATYTPGSTFKIVTAAAALDTLPDAETRTYTCSAGTTIDGERITCMGQHGTISLKTAFAKSCNGYFSQLAVDLGADTLTEYAEKMGFNKPMKMDGVEAATSYFNVDGARDIDLGWAGMGQYTDMMNPYQYLRMIGGIANGGVAVSPYMVERITSPYGLPIGGTLKKSKRILAEETANAVADLMDYAVENNYGKYRFPDLDVCAKSGTAEVGEEKIPHAEFVGFTKSDELPLAFVVVVENGGAGSKIAANVASKVLYAAKSEYLD
jgi:peptidoglycan glycosyltransferase